nr:hypothetical protein [Eubacterium sp.]
MKKIVSTALALALVATTAVTASAASINGGALDYTGGQTSDVVYSSISDAKTNYVGTTDDGQYYNVKAIVKVGGNTYTTGFKQGKAYIQKSRKWYANEKSRYDYQLRYTGYSNWGGNA